MPILIRELVIKAKVDAEAAAPAAAPKDKGDCGCGGSLCVEDLARILADREER